MWGLIDPEDQRSKHFFFYTPSCNRIKPSFLCVYGQMKSRNLIPLRWREPFFINYKSIGVDLMTNCIKMNSYLLNKVRKLTWFALIWQISVLVLSTNSLHFDTFLEIGNFACSVNVSWFKSLYWSAEPSLCCWCHDSPLRTWLELSWVLNKGFIFQANWWKSVSH